MKKSIAVFVLSVLMALCLVGCGDGSGEPAAVQKNEDGSVSDVVRRADKLMYENKWLVKEKRAQQNNI